MSSQTRRRMKYSISLEGSYEEFGGNTEDGPTSNTGQAASHCSILCRKRHFVYWRYVHAACRSVVCAADNGQCDKDRDYGFLLNGADGVFRFLRKHTCGSSWLQVHVCHRRYREWSDGNARPLALPHLGVSILATIRAGICGWAAQITRWHSSSIDDP